MFRHLVVAAAAAASIGSISFASYGRSPAFGMRTGVVTLQSAGPLAMGPDGVVFIGDSKGAAVYALALADRSSAAGTVTPDVADIDAKIAALLGTTRRDIVMNDMVANPRAGTLYLSVTRGRGPNAKPALIRVSPTGIVERVRLDSVAFSKLDLDRAPGVEQTFVHRAWSNSRRRDYSVTALQFSAGELFVSGVTNEEFASSPRRIAFPFNGTAAVTKVSMFHTSHGMYETEAPIATFLPVQVGGERVILAGYLCTPLATFPLRGLAPNGSLRGRTVIELGSGNGPRDIIAYDRNGEQYVVVATGRGWMARIKVADLAGARDLTTQINDKGGVAFATSSMKGIREIETLGNDSFVVLQMNADSSFSIRKVDSRAF